MSQPLPPTAEYYVPDPGYRPAASGLAIASMVCGIVSVLTFCAWYLAVPAAVVALVLGGVAKGRIKRGEAGGNGMATAGIVCGSVALVLSLLLVAAICLFVYQSRAWTTTVAASATLPPPVVVTPAATPSPTRTAAAHADLTTLSAALRAFESDVGRFPTETEGLAALMARPAGLTAWRSAYTQPVPFDPWGHPYLYHPRSATGGRFDLRSAGPDGRPGTADDVQPTEP